VTSIRDIAVALPERILTNDELAEQNPAWDMDAVAVKAGVRSRHVVGPGETAFDLALTACRALFDAGVDPDGIDAIVSCTQSPDYVMPGNAHLLHGSLGLRGEVMAFDYNLACSGFVYGLAFADSFVRSGLASSVLLVTADTYSRHINPGDRSARALFGDGAAVTHLTGDDEGGGRVAGSALGSNGKDFEKFYIPAGGMRTPSGEDTKAESTDRSGNVRSPEDIRMDGLGVWSFVNSVVPRHIEAFLAGRSLGVGDVDLFVFHQASRMTLDSLARAMGLPEEKVYDNMESVGNLVSASIPVALRSALDEQRIGAGDRVLVSGFGVGLSYGSALLEF
jgi:3-oxoacyl-[acyl-carrier-protein] synthase III